MRVLMSFHCQIYILLVKSSLVCLSKLRDLCMCCESETNAHSLIILRLNGSWFIISFAKNHHPFSLIYFLLLLGERTGIYLITFLCIVFYYTWTEFWMKGCFMTSSHNQIWSPEVNVFFACICVFWYFWHQDVVWMSQMENYSRWFA